MRMRSSISGRGTLVAQRGLVDALIEPHALAVVLFFLLWPRPRDFGLHVADVDGDVASEVGPGDHRLDAGVVGDHHADRLHALGVVGRREQDAKLVVLPDAAVASARAEHAGDRLDVVGAGAEIAQHRGDGLALAERDGAFVPGSSAGGLPAGLGQEGDVFGRDAGFEAGIGIGNAFGGISQSRMRGGRAPPGAMAARCRSSWRPRARARARRRSTAPPRSARAAGRRRDRSDEGDFRVDLGVGRVIGGAAPGAGFGEQHLCGLKEGMLADSSEVESARLPATRTNGAHAHDLAIADAAGGGVADDRGAGCWIARRRQPVGLARGGGAPVAQTASQGHLHALGYGREIGSGRRATRKRRRP